MAPDKQEEQDVTLAINIKGQALRHGLEARPENLVIRGYLSTLEWATMIKEMQAGSHNKPMKPASPAELNRSDDTSLLMIIGMVPSDPNFNASKLPRIAKAKDITASNTKILDDVGEEWYRVATLLPAKNEKGVREMTKDFQLRLCVLFHAGSDGLCRGGPINHEKVFYFSEFRTFAKSIRKRREEWHSKIKNEITKYINQANNGLDQTDTADTVNASNNLGEKDTADPFNMNNDLDQNDTANLVDAKNKRKHSQLASTDLTQAAGADQPAKRTKIENIKTDNNEATVDTLDSRMRRISGFPIC